MSKKQAIYIFGGSIVKENGKWRTTNLNEWTEFGALWDTLRVKAAYVLYKNNPELFVICSGGMGHDWDSQYEFSVAEVMKRELIELGVKEENIVKEEKSHNTWQQLMQLKDLIKKYDLQKIGIISNRYHIPRIKAMIIKDEMLSELLNKENIELVSAEEVLIESDPEKWKEKIEQGYKSENMLKRVSMEESGVRDIESGKYKLQ